MQSQISYNLVKTGWDIGIKNKILMHEHWNGVCKKQSTGGQTLPTQLICCKTILFNTMIRGVQVVNNMLRIISQPFCF